MKDNICEMNENYYLIISVLRAAIKSLSLNLYCII